MAKRKATEAELEAVAAEFKHASPELRQAMINLVREGKVVDSGHRRDGGRIVWVAAEYATRH